RHGRSAHFPVRSNVGLAGGVILGGTAIEVASCCGLESPHSGGGVQMRPEHLGWPLRSGLRPRLRSLAMAIGISWLGWGTVAGRAQYLDLWQQPERSEPAMFEPRLKYLKMDVEAERDTLRSSLGGSEVRTERLYLAPAVGIG